MMRTGVLTSAVIALVLVCVAARAAAPVLRISGAAGRDGVPKSALALSLTEFSRLPHTKAVVHSHDGKDHTYEGVLLHELLKLAGQPLGEELRGSLLSKFILVTAHDGYRVLFSLPEADPAFSDGRIIVADTVDGATLPQREGPLRIVIPSEKREARWIRMVERIEVVSSPEPVR